MACVHAAASPWDALGRNRARRRDLDEARREPLGAFPGKGLFVFTPLSWLPVRCSWPFAGNLAWNCSVAMSFPPAGEVLREAGFDHSDVVLAASLELPHLIRHAQPRALIALVEHPPGRPRRGTPPVIVRRENEIIQDADLVIGLSPGLARCARAAGAEEVHALTRRNPESAVFPEIEQAAAARLFPGSREGGR